MTSLSGSDIALEAGSFELRRKRDAMNETFAWEIWKGGRSVKVGMSLGTASRELARFLRG
jgi:cobalamin biosynthesis protein CbiG